MYNVCRRMVNNDLDAEDLLQQSFLDVFLKLHTFRGESSPGAWIKRIVINNCINFLKKRNLRLEFLDDKLLRLPTEPDTPVEKKLDVAAIGQALAALPDGYRIVFTLYMFEGYDHQEIASILDVTESTSKSQLSRARQRMRELLAGKELLS
ncbi:MAG: hypothetical protein RLY31_1314 [Bacteroidota bacterium]